VADAFTQVNQGGPGHLVINRGYAQFVSCFTTFCTYGFKVVNGGFANISNSVIDFGNKGLISKTYFPTAYNTAVSNESKYSVVNGFEITQDGAGYTGSIAGVSLTAPDIIGGIQATAEAVVSPIGTITSLYVIQPGTGYTSEPIVTINPPPSSSFAVQATATSIISGVTRMKMLLADTTQSVEISSNMVLNGSDYLVTNVETGSSISEKLITTFPNPPQIVSGSNVFFHKLSNISTGGLVMEYVGSGVTYNALPKFGGVPNRAQEIIQLAPGRVFYSTVDNIGNLKIGEYFSVDQLTGEVTIDARNFNLSGINQIGPFRRNGISVGELLREVSDSITLINTQGVVGTDTVPTQNAVKTYVDNISASLDSRLDSVEYSASFINNQFNTLNTNLNGVVSGSLQISALGFISASQTASMNVNSASYALTASYALNAGTTVNTGSLITTSSFNSFSQSIVGRVSALEAGGGSGGSSGSFLYEQASPAITWSITHNLNYEYPSVTVYDSNNKIIIPDEITSISENALTITFASAEGGWAHISRGVGGATVNFENINIDSSRYLHTQPTAATNWSVTHSLEYDYPSVTVYDNSDRVIIPEEITRVSNTRLTISFASPTSGNAHISVGGISNLAGDRYLHTQSNVSNNWAISHNLNWQYVNIDVYDANNQLLIPQSVIATDANTTNIAFAAPTSGKAIISKGGATVNSPLTSNGPNAYVLAGALEVNGNVTATGYITTSDIRLKTNLEEIGGALDKIERLNAYTYDWIDTYNSDNIRQIGLISQEVKEVQPELVYETEMVVGDQLEKVLLLDYSKVTTLLIGAVKELSEKVKELEKNQFIRN